MKKYSIILVENDTDERSFMTESFEQSERFDVINAFGNGDELVRWLESSQAVVPEVVLTDLNMPGKNGYDIMEYLRQSDAYKEVTIIVTSTSSTSTSMNRSIAAGADDYMVKPEIFIDYNPFVNELARRLDSKKEN